MAVDTQTKRRSALAATLAFLVVAPLADGTVANVDREHIVGIYAGIAPAAPGVQTNDLHILSTTTVEPNHVSDSGDNLLLAGQIEAQTGGFFGGVTSFSKFEPDGTLEFNGAATVFEDIVINLSAARVPAANAPTWSGFISNLNAYTYGLNDFQEFSAEIMHSYKEGSLIEFHAHGATNGQEGLDKTIKFEIEYEIVDNNTSGDWGDTYTGTTLMNGQITIPSGTADKTAWAIDVGDDITGNFLQGASVVGRVRRIASTGTEPVANPFVIQLGMHIEQDTVGSRTELTK